MSSARRTGSLQLAADTPVRVSQRGQRRKNKILKVARRLFLKQGYSETSVDQIIQQSGGSKGTLYAYFPTKADLFSAVVKSIVTGAESPALCPEQPVEDVLAGYAESRVRVVASKQHVALVRLIVAEQARFPDIARMYWEQGPQVGKEALSAYFSMLARRGRMAVDDATEAAETFIALLMGTWYFCQLYVPSSAPSIDALQRHVRRVIQQFLILYPPLRD